MSLDMNIINELKDKIDEAKIKLDEVQYKSKEKLEEAIKETKGHINATKENYELWIKDKESEVFSESLKIKMNLETKFNEVKLALEQKKYDHDKNKKRAKMEKSVEHAEHAASFAIWSIEEATLAYLEAIEAKIDYIENYGNDDNKA